VGIDDFFGLFMSAGGAIDHGPPGPRRYALLSALISRAGEKLKLLDARTPLADRGPEAIRAGVAAAENNDVLVLRGERIGHLGAEVHLVLLRKVIHREMNPLQLAAGHR